MYNLRYHIASLVSVFLALALGLVLGGLIVQRGTFDRQGTSLVKGLQQEFGELRDENRQLEAENEQLAALSSDFVGTWIQDRLADKTVILLTNAGRDDGTAAVREAIRDAGGQVAVVTMLSPRFGLDDDALAERVASLASDPARAEASIAASLTAEWTTPDAERPLTAALVDAGVLSIDGIENGVAPVGLVNVAASDGEADSGALAVAAAMRSALVVSVGGETPLSETGVAAASAGSGLSALDTLGTELGRYTLVALLTGAESGYYGTGASAQALHPAVVIESR